MILDLIYDQAEENELYHHGILGMHWGVRRFQPYGQGYDPKNEGKEVGLAARMGGGHGSFSSTYGRGRSKSEIAKAALKSFGKKAYGATQELADRANYAADRASRKLSEAGKKARSGLARYAAKYDEDTARRTGYDSDPMLTKLYEMGSSKLLMKRVGEQFGKDAKRKVSDLKRTSWDDVRSAMGDGASRFQESMAKTKIASKQFSTNAQATMALLRGAMDRSSSASQILEGRFVNSISPIAKSMAIETANATAPRDYLKYIRGDLEPIGKNKYWQAKPGNNYALSRGSSAGYKIPEIANSMNSWNSGKDTPLTISPSYPVAYGKYESYVDRMAKRMGVIPLSDVSSSSSTDIGKRLLGL